MPVRPLDTLLAIKVLGLVPGLNASERRVATVLIEHYNRRTSQCDPGLERIAALVNCSTRTVIRSNHKLERTGLFRKVRHGGHGNRNSYEPIWMRFAEFEVAWRSKLKEAAQSRATRLSLAQRQPRHVPGDGSVTQTCNNNLHKEETCSKGHPRKERGEDLLSRLCRRPITGSTRSGDAARASAERRWSTALHERFVSLPVTYGEIIEAVDLAMQAAATEAEMRQRGAGLKFILDKLRLYDIKSVPSPHAEFTEPAPDSTVQSSASDGASDNRAPSNLGNPPEIAARVSRK
jgi:hypothetical protein